MNWTHIYLFSGVVGLFLSAVFTAVSLRVAHRVGALDRPGSEDHKGHARPVPLLGGPAMFLAWGLTLGVGLLWLQVAPALAPEVTGALDGVRRVAPQLMVIVVAGGALTLLGVMDDRRVIAAKWKFLGQLVVAVSVAAAGVRITFFVDSTLVSVLGTVLWTVFVINAVNFLDNMDGLAAGIATIAAVFFTIIAALQEEYFVATLAAVTAGVAAGFLVHNRPPASVFMGDAGSHLIGFLLAVLGALTTYYAPETTPTPAPVLIPLLILAVPVLDLIVVVAVRIRNGKPVHVGDHTHISHRFEQMGFSRAQSVLLIYLLVFATGASGVCLVWLPWPGVALALLQLLAIVTAVGILQYSRTGEGAGRT